MFRGAIKSDGRKLLVKCPNKLNAVGYLENLKIYEEKGFISLTLFFNKIVLLCINGRLFFPRIRVKGTGMAIIQSRSESY